MNIFCYICASLPDGGIIRTLISDNFFTTKILILITLCVWIHILLHFGNNFACNIRFIPHNVSLNMLHKRRKSKYFIPLYTIYAYLIFLNLFISEEKSSIIVYLTNWYMMNTALFKTILTLPWLYLRLLYLITFAAIQLISFMYTYILYLWCFPFEFSAFWIFNLLLLLSSDVHPNPGPNYNTNRDFSNGFFSFCNWNLNTLSKDNFNRISLLEAHNTIFNYDIISLCETSLNDETPVPENALPGYKYHPLNHPSGNKNGGVGIRTLYR